VLGQTQLYLQHRDKTTVTFAIVARGVSHQALISWHDLKYLGVISPNFPDAQCSATSAVQLRDKILSSFPTVFRDVITETPMVGEPVHIHLRENAVPFRISVARPIPLRFQEAAEKSIKQKGDGKSVRLVTDYTKLNSFVERPVHPFPSVIDILQAIPASAKLFAKFDAVNGYFQIPLDEHSSRLTTFLLPSGRYRYLRIPQGLNASSDEWCRRSDAVVEGLAWARKIVDDILIWGEDIASLHARILEISNRAKALNVILSRKKFVIGDELPFAGYIVSSKGISPNQERVSAIKDFPTPVDTTGIKSFMGLANQLSFFIPDFAHQTRGMRALLGKNTVFQWLPEHQEEFNRIKTILTDKMLTCHFDPKLPVHLLTDASRHHGLGYALCQPSSDGSLRLITCGSKSLTPTQQRYATVVVSGANGSPPLGRHLQKVFV